MRILIVCNGNICRGPMLQVLLAEELRNRELHIPVETAGILDRAGTPACEQAQICMHERGLDLSTHFSRRAWDLNLETYDRIYVMEPQIEEDIVNLAVPRNRIIVLDPEHGGVESPRRKELDAYRACADILERHAALIADELEQNALH